jgi:hypothetical protein
MLKKIETNFVLDKKTKTYMVRPGKYKAEFFAALQYVMSFIHSRAAFTMSDFLNQLVDLMRELGLKYEHGLFEAQFAHIELTIMCLLSGTKYRLPDDQPAACFLSCEKNFSVPEGARVLSVGAKAVEPNSFGQLSIFGEVAVDLGEGVISNLSYPMISSDLNAYEHCDQSIVCKVAIPSEQGEEIADYLNFDPQMALTGDFKLIRADQV